MPVVNIGLVYLSRSGGESIPIGLLTLASVLKSKFPHHGVRIIDINYEDPLRTILSGKYDLLGIGCATCEYESAGRLARRVKEKTDIPIIIGGVHISTLPGSFRDCFDIGVMGEGEQTLCDLVALYEGRKSFSCDDLKSINGLVYRHGSELVITPQRELIEDLDTIPKLDYSLLNKGYFARRPLVIWGEAGRHALVLSARGCPYRCLFCATAKFWHKVRRFSARRFIDEISDLVNNYGVNRIQIWDDLFTLDKRRLREIAEEFRRQSLQDKVRLCCSSRANIIDDELCGILKSMNVDIVGFGFESGNERVLKYIKNDSVTVEQNRAAIDTCIRNDILPSGAVIFGSPTETIEEMKDTLKFIEYAKNKKAHSVLSFIMTPYPGTEMWRIAESRGRVSDDMNFDDIQLLSRNNPLLLDDDIDREEFRRIFDEAAGSQSYFRWLKIQRAFRRNPAGTLWMGMLYIWPILRNLYRFHVNRRFAYGRGDVDGEMRPSSE